MTSNFLAPDPVEFRYDLDGGKIFLSTLRLWEHGVLGQVNVTNIPISPRSWASQINRHIDVIECVNGVETIVCSLQDICDGRATLKGFGRGSDGAYSRESSLLSDGGWQSNPAVLADKSREDLVSPTLFDLPTPSAPDVHDTERLASELVERLQSLIRTSKRYGLLSLAESIEINQVICRLLLIEEPVAKDVLISKLNGKKLLADLQRRAL